MDDSTDDEPAAAASSSEEEEEEDRFLCVKKAQARAAVAMDSEKTSSVEVDEVLDVYESVEVEDPEYGITVIRIRTQKGWVSLRTVAGNVLFEPVDADEGAAAALRRAVALRARAAALAADADDSDDDDVYGESGKGGCGGCMCGLLRNVALLLIALFVANLHFQFVDVWQLMLTLWYSVSAKAKSGALLTQTVAPPLEVLPEETDPLFGVDVVYPSQFAHLQLGGPSGAAGAEL